MFTPILADVLTGDRLVSAVWSSVGVVIVFGAVLFIIFKFFIGAQKNIGGGVAALAGVAVMAFLASKPDIVMGIGESLGGIIGLK